MIYKKDKLASSKEGSRLLLWRRQDSQCLVYVHYYIVNMNNMLFNRDITKNVLRINVSYLGEPLPKLQVAISGLVWAASAQNFFL